MDLSRLKQWVAARVQKQQEQSGTTTQAEIVETLRPLYNAKIASGLKPRAAVEAMQAELADGGMADITLTVAMFRTPKRTGFVIDKPSLRTVVFGWRTELRAMVERGMTEAELVDPVRRRVKDERPDLAAVADMEITEALVHEVVAKRRSRSKPFLPSGAPIPVAELVSKWRGQIKQRVKRGWTIAQIVSALRAKVQDEYQGVNPAEITDDLVRRVIDTANKPDNDTPVQSASVGDTATTNSPIEMVEDDIDWAHSKLPTMIYARKDATLPQIGQLWHRNKTSVMYRALGTEDDKSMGRVIGHKVAVEIAN